MMRKERQEERLCTNKCKMCQYPFKQFEMEKSLPFRMLMLYKMHTYMSGRNSMNLQHLRVTASAFLSHSVRVCRTCFMLVV